MRLDDAIRNASRRGGHRSQIDMVVEQMNPEEAKALLEVYLPDRSYSGPQIARALAELGFTVSRHAISEWRARNAPR